MSQPRHFSTFIIASAISALVAPVSASQIAYAADRGSDADADTETYIVQLDDLPVAEYDGGIEGIPATKPSDGEKVDASTSAAREYTEYLDDEQDEALEEAGTSEKDILYRYDTVFNGVAANLTEAEVEAMRKNPDVMEIWKNETLTSDTISTPDYLGLSGEDGVWNQQFGGHENAGEGMIIGVIDTGFWPEHPSFANMEGATIPDDWEGECIAGKDADVENRVTCNNKVIGARYYNEEASIGDKEFISPRDYDSHGSHTAATAAGNYQVPASFKGDDLGLASGMAPRAQISVYKALWSNADGENVGQWVDLLAAINDSVADGVDVINYSISGSRSSVMNPIERAFASAAEAGVFVAISAGNSGGDVGKSSVAHNAPWTTTVAASTHPRDYTTSVTLGDGSTYEGPGMSAGVESTSLVYAGDIPADGVDAEDAAICKQDVDEDTDGDQISLDADKATGKIVICDRGEVARVQKGATVAEAGGVGMIHVNLKENASLDADFHQVPTIHVAKSEGAAIKAYESSAAAPTATIAAAKLTTAVAPKMAPFSSYGPALAGNGDMLKPDITAPGVNVVAAASPASSDDETFASLSGTSMSAPHIAGLALLMKQAHPEWSPAAVKSAMMTTAQTTNTDSEPIQTGDSDATPMNYGSGEVVPASAYTPGLVYDAGVQDWASYVCAIGQLTGPPCEGLDTDASDLNYPSIAIGESLQPQTVTRTVTNVTDEESTYTSDSSQAPEGLTMKIEPTTITVPAGGEATFTVTFEPGKAKREEYAFGTVVWEPTADAGKGAARVTSQVAVQPTYLSMPENIVGTGSEGSHEYSMTAGFDGTLDANKDIDGLARPEIETVNVVRDRDTAEDGSLEVVVPKGTKVVRFATFTDEQEARNIDLQVLDPDENYAGGSARDGAQEEVTVIDPEPGTWTVLIDLTSDIESAKVPINTFLVDDQDNDTLTVTPGSVEVKQGEKFDLTASWSGLFNGRYLGKINYTVDGDDARSSLVYITVDDSTDAPKVKRIGGTDRFDTAAKIAAQYSGEVNTVYIASGLTFADALSAAAPAANAVVPSTMKDADGEAAPVLLTRSDSLPEATVTALEELDPSQIVVLGGSNAIQPSVLEALEAYGDVERIGGTNRYDTSAQLAKLYPEDVSVVYLASGADGNFADALSGGALAGSQDAPVLLTRPDRVDDATTEALKYLNADRVVVLGGEAAISPKVYEAVGAKDRLAGGTRYDTAVAVSKEFKANVDGTFVASGETFPDALAGSALAGSLGYPMTLSAPGAVPKVVMDELNRLSPNTVSLLGGTAALSEAVERRLNAAYPAWAE